MNVLLAAVAERTREVGLRKSVGARRTATLTQFLTESLTLSPDGTRLASASNDGTVKPWDPDTGAHVLTFAFESQVYHLGWSPDGRRLGVVPLDGTIRMLAARPAAQP